ncbi:Protein kinase domain [Macleaya cordata]|uniref:Protein kinase domain n=1 Tax=Macleaya cordata TaxID=56857 RepID=A0A200PQP2_MACCD|nr:Protein kinase domain [Macleaya cordata]
MWRRISVHFQSVSPWRSVLKQNNVIIRPNQRLINSASSSSATIFPFHRTAPLFSQHATSDSDTILSKGKKAVEDVMPIATGHEREEIEAELQGRNLQEMDYPEGPFAGISDSEVNESVVVVLVVLIITFRIALGESKAFFLIFGVSIAGILGIITWIFRQLLADRRLKCESISEGRELRLGYSFLRKVAGVPTKFRYKDLEEATDNFQALLGRGASASVFRGILEDGTQIAVKRIEGAEHGEREFLSEVAAIASVQHFNLVRLLGFSTIPGGPRLLVYEFIQNRSLDTWIFPRTSIRHSSTYSSGLLSWNLRYRVAIDVAKALAYLHHDCRSRILHLDVKPENILLDENFRALVSDFGLSKLMGRDESRVYTTVRGTRGYLAPEWLLEHGISEKSDIYSYGMVLLEIVGGRRNVRLEGDGENSQRKWSYFPRIVVEKMKEGKLMEIVDERLLGREGSEVSVPVDEREVKTLVHVALWCIQEDPRRRPSMARVVDMLEGRLKVENPPETEMIVVDLLSIDQDEPVVTRQMESRVPPLQSGYSFTLSCLSGR